MKRARRKGEPIDWQEIRARLAGAEAATEAALVLSPQRAKALMDERARSLARVASDGAAAGPTLELLTFALGRERYAIETRFVREVMRLVDFTPVPGAPAFIVGIVNHRGEVLAIADLRKILNVAEQGLTDLARVVVLGTEEPEIGVLADSVDTVGLVPVASVLEPAESVAGIGRHHLRGVTREALIVLDGAALLADERLVVEHSEPGHRT